MQNTHISHSPILHVFLDIGPFLIDMRNSFLSGQTLAFSIADPEVSKRADPDCPATASRLPISRQVAVGLEWTAKGAGER